MNKAVIRSFVGAANAVMGATYASCLFRISSDTVTLVAPPRFVQRRS